MVPASGPARPALPCCSVSAPQRPDVVVEPPSGQSGAPRDPLEEPPPTSPDATGSPTAAGTGTAADPATGADAELGTGDRDNDGDGDNDGENDSDNRDSDSDSDSPNDGDTAEPDQSPGFREIVGWIGLGLLIALVVTWPLVIRIQRVIPSDSGDPMLQLWQLAWTGHSLLHHPLSVYDSNTFYPTGPSLAYSDTLLGYAPLSMFGSGFEAAIIRYNVIFLLANALAFAGAAVLAREIGCQRIAAAAAGAVFAYAPWHLSQLGHLQVLSVGGIPLAIALLFGGYRRRAAGRVLAGWLVTTWQIAIGFGMGIYFFYVLVLLLALLTVGWLRRGRPALGTEIWLVTGAGVAITVGSALVLAEPYLQVLHRYPETRRTADYSALFSPPWRGLLIAPESSHFWGVLTEESRKSLGWTAEQCLFPGALAVALALVGLALARVSKMSRLLLAAGVALAAALSIGFSSGPTSGLYRWLYNNLPGFDAIRVSGRLTVFMLLALGVLAAMGVERLLGDRSITATSRGAFAGVLVAAIIAEGLATTFPLADVPRPPVGMSSVPGPQFHLPTGGISDAWYMAWTVDGDFPQIGNGLSGVVPALTAQLREDLKSFPSQPSVAALRKLGFRTVIVHPDLLGGTPYSDTLGRSIAGLGITREDYPGFVVYYLSP